MEERKKRKVRQRMEETGRGKKGGQKENKGSGGESRLKIHEGKDEINRIGSQTDMEEGKRKKKG